MQANARTDERRYWSTPRRKQAGQPWAAQNARSNAAPFPPVVDDREWSEPFGGAL